MTPDRFAIWATAVGDLAIALRAFGITTPEAEASMRRLGVLMAHPEVQAAYARASAMRARKRVSRYLAKGGVRR
jgi:hypothetical protein